MAYLKFIRKNSTLLVFGMLMTLLSSFGQTFLMALYVPFLMEDFRLNNTQISGFYGIATVASAFILPTLGKFIDQVDIRYYTLAATFVFVLSLIFLSFVSVWWLLPLAFFGLRMAGQGLFSHISLTAMSKFFAKGRGKAISIASLGHPIGQAALPVLVFGFITWLGWRESLRLNAGLVILIIPFYLFYLIKDKHLVDKEKSAMDKDGNEKPLPKIKQWDILKSKSFWILAPNLFMLSFAITVMFFYQFAIAEFKGWDLKWMTWGLTTFAISGIFSTLAAGPLIDKYTAKRFFPFYLIPFLIAVVCLWLFHSPLIIFVYMVLMGISTGFGNATVAALQVEFFGSTYIGTVRSLFSALMVLSSAVGPALFGIFIDSGYSISYIFVITGVLMIFVILLSFRSISLYTINKTRYRAKGLYKKLKTRFRFYPVR